MNPFCWPLIAFGVLLIIAPFLHSIRKRLPWLALAAGALAFLLPWTVVILLEGRVEKYYEFWYRTDLPPRDTLDFEGMGVYIQVPLAALMILVGLVFVAVELLQRRQTAPGPGG